MFDTDEALKQDLEAVFRRIKAAGYREGQQAAVRDIVQLVQSKFSAASVEHSGAKTSPQAAPSATSASAETQANGGANDSVQTGPATAAAPFMLNEEVVVATPRSKSLVLALVGICAFVAVGMTAYLKFPGLIPL